MRKKSKLTAGLLALLLVLTMAFPAGKVKAMDGFDPMISTVTVGEKVPDIQARPGEVLDISLPVTAGEYPVWEPIVTLDLEETPFELVSDFTFRLKDSSSDMDTPYIASGWITYINFQLKVKETARNGVYNNMKMKFLTTDMYGRYTEIELENANLFKIKVVGERSFPSLRVISQEYPDAIKAKDEFDVSLRFMNYGQLAARKVKITIEGCDVSGFIPKKLYNTVEADSVGPGSALNAVFSFTAAQTLTGGVKNLRAVVNCELEDGTVCEPMTTDIYLEAVSEEVIVPPNSDVKLVTTDYPKTVKAEESIDVSLTYENQGSELISDMKVQLAGYSEAGLIPDFIYDTVELGELGEGESKTAVFKLTAAKMLAPGTKSMTAKITYTTEAGHTYEDTVSLYLEALAEEPEEPEPVTNSMPKLLIKDYDLGTDKLMAGSEFTFKFDVLNSHSNAGAANIKVTVSSEDNTFSIIEGSSSFLISSIKAGETASCEIPLKVKGDAATGGYDLTIAFDYEYAARDENGKDISKSNTLEEKLKIPVYSNDRPKVSNIAVGYWELPKTGELTTMSFEFYNMGKSPLYNVTATVEGDFDAAGNMLMIGNVDPGSGKSWEMDVTPMAEGFGSGTLHITYEDSNGNISTFDEPFQSEIQSSAPPVIDEGGMMPGGDGMMGVDGMGVTEVKKPILPLWAFVLVQAVIFLIAVPVTKTIIVKRYKKKQLKRLENDLDD